VIYISNCSTNTSEKKKNKVTGPKANATWKVETRLKMNLSLVEQLFRWWRSLLRFIYRVKVKWFRTSKLRQWTWTNGTMITFSTNKKVILYSSSSFMKKEYKVFCLRLLRFKILHRLKVHLVNNLEARLSQRKIS